MPDFRRGAQAIADAQAKAKSSGSFQPFAPQIFWTDPAKNEEDSKKYVLFLNPMLDIPTVEYIGYIPQQRKKGNGEKFTSYESVIARTDPAIGESSDPMVDEWDAQPRDTSLAVAVLLEPVLEERNGRKRAVGFEVATTSFERRVRDDEGELTEETEEVEAPVIGFVAQSPHNFFNLITSFDADTAPIESCPLLIKRLDTKTYAVEGEAFIDMDVDLEGLVACIDNLSYLGDDVDDLLDAIDGQDDKDAALTIGAFLLDKRLEELCDEERYNKLLDGITETLNKFGSKGGGGKSKGSSRKERPQRRSSRRSRNTEPEETPEPEATEEPVEDKPARRRRSRAAAEVPAEPEAAAKDTAPAEEAEEKPVRSRATQANSKLAELRAAQEKRRASA